MRIYQQCEIYKTVAGKETTEDYIYLSFQSEPSCKLQSSSICVTRCESEVEFTDV